MPRMAPKTVLVHLESISLVFYTLDLSSQYNYQEMIKHIAICTPSWPPGSLSNGIVTYNGYMAKELNKSGLVPHIVVDSGHYFGHSDIYVDIDIHTYPSRLESSNIIQKIERQLGFYFDKNYIFQESAHLLSKAIGQIEKNFVLDIVEIEESFGIPYWLQSRISTPIVTRLHGPHFLNAIINGIPQDHQFHWRVQNEGRAIKQAIGVSAPSQNVLTETQNYYQFDLENAVVIPNPIEATTPEKRWKYQSCQPRQIAFIGRFDRHKGGDIMLEAFKAALDVYPDLTLCFAGTDPGLLDEGGRRWSLKEYLASFFPDHIIHSQLKILGRLTPSEAKQLRLDSYITIIPSRYETFSYTTLESVSQGCPTIAANVGGIKEIVNHGHNGLLFEAGNAKDLTVKILQLIDNLDLATKLGSMAAVDCQGRFSPSAIVQQTLDYYDEVKKRWQTKPKGSQ